MPPPGESGRERRLAAPGEPGENDALLSELDGAAVRRQEPALMQQRAEHRSEEKQPHLVVRHPGRRLDDDPFPLGDEESPGAVDGEQELVLGGLEEQTTADHVREAGGYDASPDGDVGGFSVSSHGAGERHLGRHPETVELETMEGSFCRRGPGVGCHPPILRAQHRFPDPTEMQAERFWTDFAQNHWEREPLQLDDATDLLSVDEESVFRILLDCLAPRVAPGVNLTLYTIAAQGARPGRRRGRRPAPETLDRGVR